MSIEDLQVYTNGANEQPTTCPKCGARTDIAELRSDAQHHKCLDCGYEFIMEFGE